MRLTGTCEDELQMVSDGSFNFAFEMNERSDHICTFNVDDQRGLTLEAKALLKAWKDGLGEINLRR